MSSDEKENPKMDDVEKEILLNSFKQIVSCAIEEKKEIPKWKKKLQKDLRVSFKLQVYPTDFLYINLIIKDGSYNLTDGEIDDYDFQIISKPEDLMWYSAGNYSILKMSLTKNDFGQFRWKFKKGGRNISSLLMVANLLLYK